MMILQDLRATESVFAFTRQIKENNDTSRDLLRRIVQMERQVSTDLKGGKSLSAAVKQRIEPLYNLRMEILKWVEGQNIPIRRMAKYSQSIMEDIVAEPGYSNLDILIHESFSVNEEWLNYVEAHPHLKKQFVKKALEENSNTYKKLTKHLLNWPEPVFAQRIMDGTQGILFIEYATLALLLIGDGLAVSTTKKNQLEAILRQGLKKQKMFVRLMIAALGDIEKNEIRDTFYDISLSGLNMAFREDEPEYGPQDLISKNPKYRA